MNVRLLHLYTTCKIACLLIAGLLLFSRPAQGQSILNKTISVNFDRARLSDALNELSKKGDFYFSYNGNAVAKDSLVSLIAVNKPLSFILSQLFSGKYEFEERRNYIIITPALLHLAMINTDVTTDNNTYSISGLVVDDRTGERLMNASVYEKVQLVSALTDEHGYFRLKFRNSAAGVVSITAGKLHYRDTTVTFLQAISVSTRAQRSTYANVSGKNNQVERTGLGRLFISARQKIQSLNIPDFFANRPFQVSLAPGLSTHGMFSPQVVNRFSVNIAGGYTAGVDGFEAGGLFNINKMNSRYVQVAGIFNLVGGTVTGLQFAGVHNNALDTVRGLQLAGFINKAGSELAGVQLSALNNEAHVLKGIQIGLVNVADSSKGVSIGLLNIIHNGFYKVTLYANDLATTNVSLKSGTHDFYSTFLASVNVSAKNKFSSFGLGVGHDFMFSPNVYVSAEAAYQFANTGLWDDRWRQAKLLLNVQLSKSISLVAGPTYNSYDHSGSMAIPGYRNVTNIPEYPGFAATGHQLKNWIGWEAGIAINSVFKNRPKVASNSSLWYLGAGVTQGIGWDQPFGPVYGAELFTRRDLGGALSGILTMGYTTYTTNDKGFSTSAPGQPIDTYILNNFSGIPVKAGIRTYAGKRIYIEGDLGAFFGTTSPVRHESDDQHGSITREGIGDKNSFLYATSAGYTFDWGLEAGIKFEDCTRFSGIKQFSLRLAYQIKLGKQ